MPVPAFDPTTEVFQPTVAMSSGLLGVRARVLPSVRRVVITSSVAAQAGAGPGIASGSTRGPLPSPVPETFDEVFAAYVMGKKVELHNSDTFVETENPPFTVSHVFPGYVFGSNELALDAEMLQTQNSSNNFLMWGMLGGEAPYPVHGGLRSYRRCGRPAYARRL